MCVCVSDRIRSKCDDDVINSVKSCRVVSCRFVWFVCCTVFLRSLFYFILLCFLFDVEFDLFFVCLHLMLLFTLIFLLLFFGFYVL